MAQQYAFGVGRLVGVRGDVANSTPISFGTLQDVALDVTFTEKELRGQNQLSVDIARGDLKVTGKAKTARINALLFNDLFFGAATPGSGVEAIQGDEQHTIPGTPFQITVAPPNSGTFVADLGVYNTATGAPLTLVASSPATGQYSVSAGVYTFAAADAGNVIAISYLYSLTGGKVITLNNQVMGVSPWFTVWLGNSFNSQYLTMKLTKCKSHKLSLPFKLDDWTLPEFEFSVMDDGTGNWGAIYTST